MLLIKFLRYILGYVRISVKGEFPEKILNIFSLKKVSVWDIEKGKNEIKLNLSVKNFFNIRNFRGKTRLKIKIIKKTGIVFILKKYFKRIGIPIGIAAFFITLYVFSLFIWRVDIVGNDNVETVKIMKKCSELGVRNGALISQIDSQLLREKLILNCEGVSWCSFNIEGSKITVNISEISKNNKENTPTNIISDYDGVITEIFVESGMGMVEKGWAVQKGDILVSGISGNNKFVKSRAKITCSIIDTIIVEGELSGERLVNSGEIKHKKVLEIFGIKIPLYLGETLEPYNENLEIKNLRFLGEKIPVLIYEKRFEILEKQTFEYSREKLLEKLNSQMQEKINDLGENVEILNRNIVENDNKLTLKYDIRYNKKIGNEEKVIFNIPN